MSLLSSLKKFRLPMRGIIFGVLASLLVQEAMASGGTGSNDKVQVIQRPDSKPVGPSRQGSLPPLSSNTDFPALPSLPSTVSTSPVSDRLSPTRGVQTPLPTDSQPSNESTLSSNGGSPTSTATDTEQKSQDSVGSAVDGTLATKIQNLVDEATKIKEDWDNKAAASRDEEQKDTDATLEITTKYEEDLKIIVKSKAEAANLPVTPESAEENRQALDTQAEEAKTTHTAEYADAAKEGEESLKLLEDAMNKIQKDLEQARLANTKRLEEMRAKRRQAEEEEKAKKLALEKEIADKTRRLENERRDAMAKANEEEVQIQDRIKTETQERLAVTQGEKKKRMASFMQRVIYAVKTVTNRLTGQNNAHDDLQTDHTGLEGGHTELVKRVDSNDTKHREIREDHQTLKDGVTTQKEETDAAIKAAEVKATTEITEAKKELDIKLKSQKVEINDHLGEHDINHEITKKHIVYVDRKTSKDSTQLDAHFKKAYDAHWQDTKPAASPVSGADQEKGTATEKKSPPQSPTNSGEVKLDSKGEVQSRRRLACMSPSEQALERRRLMNRPKSHLVVLEQLLEEINRLN